MQYNDVNPAPAFAPVVLVTGASSGIGRATAEGFARTGATVVVTARREAQLLETVSAVDHLGGSGAAVVADLTRPGAVDHLIDEVIGRYGRLDVAVNNAGTLGSFAALLDQTEEDFDQTVALNLKAVWLLVRRQARHMVSQGGGSIVNVSSWLATGALPGSATYSATKAALDGFTRACAVEFAPQGVRINNVNPGGIDTEMTRTAFDHDAGVLERFGQAHPAGRLGTPAEVADLIVYLASTSASFIHGQAIHVDAGYTIGGQR
ncbi:SDR family NAD(P)-dependent oxidoreductase [Mycolicibacterium sp. XJ870]